MNKLLAFDDVLILPQFSHIKSRKDVKTISEVVRNEILETPIISSNMDTVTGRDMAVAMGMNGARGCLHRFQSIEENCEMFYESTIHQQDGITKPWVSVGLGDLELERASALYDEGANTFVIDVAHGASIEVVKQTKAIRDIIGSDCNIIVGNFATGRTIKDFIYHLGNSDVQGFKVGIGGGSACLTRVVTGCGAPSFGSTLDCIATGYPIICDGGIRNSGDFSKALAAGAKAVMMGGIFAGCDESPGKLHVEYTAGKGTHIFYHGIPGYHPVDQLDLSREFTYCNVSKKYRGSASKESYEVQGKIANHRTAEGDSFTVTYRGPVHNIIQEYNAALRSSMSYVGATTIEEFHKNAEFIEVTGAGATESKAHGKKL